MNLIESMLSKSNRGKIKGIVECQNSDSQVDYPGQLHLLQQLSNTMKLGSLLSSQDDWAGPIRICSIHH